MKRFAKKLFLYLLGLFILAIGVNIAKTAQLGISPVSAVPYACELIWGIELGKASIIVYVILMGLQVLLLRKDYDPKQLLQIGCTYILGTFITYTSTEYLLSWLPMPSSYIVKLIYMGISILFIGIGVSIYLIPNFPPLPPEGLMAAIVKKTNGKIEFANAKVAVDSSLVIISAILSLVFLGGLKSVREGTVLAALLVGKVVGLLSKRFKEPIVEWMEKDEEVAY